MPPRHDIAHLGHVELRSPRPQDTVDFFVDYLGMTVTATDGASATVHAFDDYETTTVRVVDHPTTGIGRTSLRATDPEALERLVKSLAAHGHEGTWQDGDPGYGPTYVVHDPDGHEFGIYHETQWYEAPDDRAPALKNQAAARPSHGVGVRRLDHVNYLARDVATNRAFMTDALGAMATEEIRLDDGTVAAGWTTFTHKSYDTVYTRDHTGSRGRLHHLAFATDTREEILKAADLAIEQGVFIETGPHKHAIQQTFFLYVYEPAGNRIELCNAGARLVLAPDWRLVTWTQAERAKGQAWGLHTIESFHTHGTPPVEGA